MSQLAGKVAIVTGAASGIGRAIAQRFAAEGAVVVIADLALESVHTVVVEIEATGGAAMAVAMDVTDEQAVNAGIAAVIERFGKIDILVSNAGVQIVHPLDEFPFEGWKRVLAIHLDGAFLTTRACLKHMYRTGGGSIVYIGSAHSKVASVLKAPYVTAKHGLVGLCRVVAKEGASHNVRANVVCPGFVRTPLVEKQIPEQAARLNISEPEVVRDVMLRDTVDGQFTTLKEVADAVLYFAAAETGALTGQSLLVSHGWVME